jgi:hypothetical protein
LIRKLDRVTVLDVLFVGALLALPGWTLVRSLSPARTPTAAFIYQDNRLLGAYQLDRDQVVLVGDPRHPDMRIEIRNGAVRVAESDCPRGVCRQSGRVRTPGRSIVCVPNHVLIELRGEATGYDAESY